MVHEAGVARYLMPFRPIATPAHHTLLDRPYGGGGAVAHDREGARAEALGGVVAAHRREVVRAAPRRLPAMAEVQLPEAHPLC